MGDQRGGCTEYGSFIPPVNWLFWLSQNRNRNRNHYKKTATETRRQETASNKRGNATPIGAQAFKTQRTNKRRHEKIAGK